MTFSQFVEKVLQRKWKDPEKETLKCIVLKNTTKCSQCNRIRQPWLNKDIFAEDNATVSCRRDYYIFLT